MAETRRAARQVVRGDLEEEGRPGAGALAGTAIAAVAGTATRPSGELAQQPFLLGGGQAFVAGTWRAAATARELSTSLNAS